MPGLLVSVRSPQEALAALAGGADIIDVKEPANGSLGRAEDDVIRAVVDVVAGRRPVSAAMGELVEESACSIAGLNFLKWGLAECVPLLARPARSIGWADKLARLRRTQPAEV